MAHPSLSTTLNNTDPQLPPSRHHTRSLSGLAKKGSATSRPVRSSLLKRDTSKTQLSKLGAAPSDRPKSRSKDPVDEDVMATSFLQYCTTCERQISVPSTSVLYCSEACRKKDAHKSGEYPLFSSDLSPPPSPRRSQDHFSTDAINIIPQRSPTSYPSPFSSHRTSIVNTSSEEDLMEEYVPSRTPSSTSLSTSVIGGRISMSRHDQEAGSYLQQYYSSRPTFSRRTSHAPSLSHTPNSTAGSPVPFTPLSHTGTSARHITNRSYSRPSSIHFSSSKSVDLVTPITLEQQKSFVAPSSISTVTDSDRTLNGRFESLDLEDGGATGSIRFEGRELSYDKRPAAGSVKSTTTGSLKALFEFDQMRSGPR